MAPRSVARPPRTPPAGAANATMTPGQTPLVRTRDQWSVGRGV
jgi:hypothetical protein